MNTASTAQRHARLFRNGSNQALRIPKEFELDADSVILRREGDRLVIEPVRRGGLLALLKTWEPEEDGLPEIPDHPAEPVEL